MSDKHLPQLIATSLLLVMASVAGGLLFIYYQFPHLDNYNDTYLVHDSLQADYALSLCLVISKHEQILQTNQSDGVIWQRVSAQWTNGESKIMGNGGEAQYERDILPVTTIRSSLFFQSARPYNGVFVNNQLTFQLPSWLCHPSAHAWPDMPARQFHFLH